MKIYTKTGDKGTTKLVDGSCVEKFNPRVEAYGCVDELNSQVGLTRTFVDQNTLPVDALLEKIQNLLFNTGSLLATSEKTVFEKMPQIKQEHILWLERCIDQYSEELPPLTHFVLPFGSVFTCQLHLCRTFCRRAERRSSEILVTDAHYDNVLIFLNRLSDFFFVLARWSNLKSGIPDQVWKKEHAL